MITAKLIQVDSPTVNGRIYPRAVLEEAISHWQQHFQTKTMPVFKAASAHPKVEDIVGFAENFRIEDGFLVADVGFIPGRESDVGKEGETINIRPNGIGVTDSETGIVQEGYRMVGLCIRHQNPVVEVELYEKE